MPRVVVTTVRRLRVRITRRGLWIIIWHMDLRRRLSTVALNLPGAVHATSMFLIKYESPYIQIHISMYMNRLN